MAAVAGKVCAVVRWVDLPGTKRHGIPARWLAVLVAGEYAGSVEPVGGTWAAHWHLASYRDRVTEHATAQDAAAAVLRSGWARKLGARASSHVHWSTAAQRVAAR